MPIDNTRLSSESAMYRLGGDVISAAGGKDHLGCQRRDTDRRRTGRIRLR